MLIYILGVCEAKVSEGHDFGSVCFYLIFTLEALACSVVPDLLQLYGL